MSHALARIHRFALELLLVIWVVACSVASWLGGGLIPDVGIWQIPIGMLGIIAGVISGAYFFVIFTIPFKLASLFDPIKNKVALREYKTVDAFQLEIAQFIVNFFHYAGANVEGGIFQFKNCESLKLNFDEEIDLQQFENEKEVRKIKTAKGSRLFFVPVILEDVEMGWMLLKMEGFTMSLFAELISDFENMYLDDQLLHILYQHGLVND